MLSNTDLLYLDRIRRSKKLVMTYMTYKLFFR